MARRAQAEQIRDCICADPENCTQPMPGHRCRKAAGLPGHNAEPRGVIALPEPRVEKARRMEIAAPPGQEEGALVIAIARAAADPTVDVGKMERLFAIHQTLVAQKAEREFTEAMTRFKEDAPKIIKTKQVDYPTKDASGNITGRVSYKHATIGDVCAAVIKGLAGVGISHRWDLARKDGRIYVTCVLTGHGHHTETTLDGEPDNSGKKNSLQQSASTITYLQRYTLLGATGFATEDDDDDGRLGGGDPDTPRVNAEQIGKIEALGKKLGADKDRFLEYIGFGKIEDIPAASYDMVVRILEQRAKRQKPHAEAPTAKDAAKTVWTEVPLDLIKKKIDLVGIPEREFLAHFELVSIGDLPLKFVNSALDYLEALTPKPPNGK